MERIARTPQRRKCHGSGAGSDAVVKACSIRGSLPTITGGGALTEDTQAGARCPSEPRLLPNPGCYGRPEPRSPPSDRASPVREMRTAACRPPDSQSRVVPVDRSRAPVPIERQAHLETDGVELTIHDSRILGTDQRDLAARPCSATLQRDLAARPCSATFTASAGGIASRSGIYFSAEHRRRFVRLGAGAGAGSGSAGPSATNSCTAARRRLRAGPN
jgi:hypothetical protein